MKLCWKHFVILYHRQVVPLKLLLELVVSTRVLREKIFSLTDSLSSSMQGKNVTACNAKGAADIVCKKITKLQSYEQILSLIFPPIFRKMYFEFMDNINSEITRGLDQRTFSCI